MLVCPHWYFRMNAVDELDCNQYIKSCNGVPTVATLEKVSDWYSFQVNQNYPDSFRYLYPNQWESFRTNPKNVLYPVWWKRVKNQSDLIRLIPRHQSEWIRTNPKPSFQSSSIRNNPRSEWFAFILIDNSIWINPSSYWFVFISIEN